MRSKIVPILAALFFFLTVGSPLVAQKGENKKNEPLAQKYKEWLDLVTYIITPIEKQIFSRLSNEREREAFINIFWRQRDPTKGTPENEFMTEHLKRFDYANRVFKYGSPKAGWKTDRGRIHILLGPPVNRNEVIKNGLYPIEIWEYYGTPEQGLPTMFNVVFYKRHGSGEFKLYVPVQDGPESLLVTQIGEIDSIDYATIYEKIWELDTNVAKVCLSLTPDESSRTMTPSLRDTTLISRIYELPQDKINTTYATNFLKYRGYVNIDESIDYVPSRNEVALIRDPILNMNFVHFAILPERLSVDYSPEKDQYYFNYVLTINLKKGDSHLFQYSKNFPFYYSKEDLDRNFSFGLVITDLFPVIAGEFELSILLQNSVNKEFSYVEKKIVSPPADSPLPNIYGPFLAYQINDQPQSVFSAFKFHNRSIKIDTKHEFGKDEAIQVFFAVDRARFKNPFAIELEVKSNAASLAYSKKYTQDSQNEKEFLTFTPTLEKMAPGFYTLTVSLRDPNNVEIKNAFSDFSISLQKVVPHPPQSASLQKAENVYVYSAMLANQYENNGQPRDAEKQYETAVNLNPGNLDLVKSYCGFLYNQKKYDQLLVHIEKLSNHPKYDFDYFALKGKALYQKGEFSQAIETLLKANQIYDSDTTVLNALGLSLIQLNNFTEARKALSASLRLNDKQKDIAKALSDITSK